MDFAAIEKESRLYLDARKRFLEFAKSEAVEAVLKGNDQILGSRIGEFIAYRILHERGLNPIKSKAINEKAIDITCTDDYKVSVKLFTGENVLGRTTKIKKGWNELILIELDKNYQIRRVGLLTAEQLDKAKMGKRGLSDEPTASVGLLNNTITKFGKIIQGEEVTKYLP